MNSDSPTSQIAALRIRLQAARRSLRNHRRYICENAREERFHAMHALDSAKKALGLRDEIRALRPAAAAEYASDVNIDQSIDAARDERVAS